MSQEQAHRLTRCAGWRRPAAAVPVLLVAMLAAASGGQASAQPYRAPAVAAGTISTIAGGVGGPGRATSVALSFACGLTVHDGSLYVGNTGYENRPSSGSVQQVSPQGELTTLVGTGAAGAPGNGQLATQEGVGACGTALDSDGNLVLTDNNKIKVVAAKTGTFYGQQMTAGHIYTVAGDGTLGASTPGAVATKTSLSGPVGVVVDQGNLVITDSGFDTPPPTRKANGTLQVVAGRTGKFFGRAMTAGHIYNLAGSPHGAVSLGEALGGLRVDKSGNIVFACGSADTVLVLAAKTGTFYGQQMTAGNLYTVAGNGQAGYSGNGGPATEAELWYPAGVALDSYGNLIIADSNNGLLRVVAVHSGTYYGLKMKTGDIYTVAGHVRGTSPVAGINDVVVDPAGNLVTADTTKIKVLAAATGTFYGVKMTAGGLYTIAGTASSIYSGNGGPATAAVLSGPEGLADNATGLAIADTPGNQARVVPATSGTFYGQQMTAGDIYDVAGTGNAGDTGNGGPGTKAELYYPRGVALGASGDLLIADTFNDRVRIVPAVTGTYFGQQMTAGDIYNLAGTGKAGGTGNGGPATTARISAPEEVTTDSAGNVVFADTGNDQIRVVAATTGTFYGQQMTAGDIYAVAAGDGLDGPEGVAAGAAGDLAVADTGNQRIGFVAGRDETLFGQKMTTGHFYTVAGDGGQGDAGDGGPGTKATLDYPSSVAIDTAGNVIIADGGYQTRVVAATTGTFYGVRMTAGDIYAVAGDGTPGYTGDGGPALSAELASPGAVAVSPAGDLLIGDYGSGRVREVTG